MVKGEMPQCGREAQREMHLFWRWREVLIFAASGAEAFQRCASRLRLGVGRKSLPIDLLRGFYRWVHFGLAGASLGGSRYKKWVSKAGREQGA